MKFRFPIVIIDEDFRTENTSGSGIRALAAAIEEAAEVVEARRAEMLKLGWKNHLSAVASEEHTLVALARAAISAMRPAPAQGHEEAEAVKEAARLIANTSVNVSYPSLASAQRVRDVMKSLLGYVEKLERSK